MTESRDKKDLEEESPARLLAGATSVETHESVEARRPVIVALLEREIASAALAAKRRRRVLAIAGGVAAAAAVSLLASWLGRSPAPESGSSDTGLTGGIPDGVALVVLSHGAPHTSRDPSTSLKEGKTVPSGQTLLTNATSELHLELGGKTNVEMASLSSLELEKAELHNQEFFLRRGRVSLDVAHPKELGPRLVRVTTPEARVTVRGTRFGVEVKSNPETHLEYTYVWVERGSVAVDAAGGSVLLGPGEDWRSDRKELRGPSSTKEASAELSATEESSSLGRFDASEGAAAFRGERRRAVPSAAPTVNEPRPSRDATESETLPQSTLKQQNFAFEEALRESRAGHSSSARTKLRAFLERYPTSPLKTAALTELRRLESL